MREFRPTGFQILPVVIKNLMIINAIFFLAQNTIGLRYFNMEEVFALHTIQSPLFKPWQLVTHMFMHGDMGHIFSNMLALWMFGSVLENYWGPKRFLTFYFVCGIGAAFAHLGVLYYENQQMIADFHRILTADDVANFSHKYFRESSEVFNAQSVVDYNLKQATLGASGAVFGCLAAFGYLFPNTLIYFYFFIPVKAKWFVLIYAAFELSMAIHNSAGDNVAHVAHLGGALAGIVMVYFWNKRNRNTFY